jgi:hypothetical protein
MEVLCRLDLLDTTRPSKCTASRYWEFMFSTASLVIVVAVVVVVVVGVVVVVVVGVVIGVVAVVAMAYFTIVCEYFEVYLILPYSLTQLLACCM